MTSPVAFLMGLGQALSAFTLYSDGHPSRTRAVKAAWDALDALFSEGEEAVVVSFLGDEVVFDRRVLKEVKGWEWAERLSGVGMERLEFIAPVRPDLLAEFVRMVHDRTSAGTVVEAGGLGEDGGIRWGRIAIGEERLEDLAERVIVTPVAYSLREEVEGVQWIQEATERSDAVPVAEATAIVRSLALAMRQEGRVVLPLLELLQFDQFTVTHSCNVSVLAMGLAEYLGMAPREVRAVGVAGLLHDIGKVKVSKEMLNKPGPLTVEERREVERHPVEGARLILSRHRHMDLAAVVAYEHHIRLDGGGYPTLAFPRQPHLVSRMVAVCETYDAYYTSFPWQQALPPAAALLKVEQASGKAFDPEVVTAFAAMLRGAKTQRVPVADPVVTVDGERREREGREP
jgi:putative nucleotidyltransferase with HDIG domain